MYKFVVFLTIVKDLILVTFTGYWFIPVDGLWRLPPKAMARCVGCLAHTDYVYIMDNPAADDGEAGDCRNLTELAENLERRGYHFICERYFCFKEFLAFRRRFAFLGCTGGKCGLF